MSRQGDGGRIVREGQSQRPCDEQTLGLVRLSKAYLSAKRTESGVCGQVAGKKPRSVAYCHANISACRSWLVVAVGGPSTILRSPRRRWQSPRLEQERLARTSLAAPKIALSAEAQPPALVA